MCAEGGWVMERVAVTPCFVYQHLFLKGGGGEIKVQQNVSTCAVSKYKYRNASLERIKKNSTLLKASSNQSIQHVFPYMYECFLTQSYSMKLWRKFISFIVWFIVWPRKCRGTTNLSLRWCKVAKSNIFLTSLWWFFLKIDSIDVSFISSFQHNLPRMLNKSILVPNAVFPFMFPQSKHSIITNKMQLSSSNLFQFDFISRELNQARNQRGVWLWNT